MTKLHMTDPSRPGAGEFVPLFSRNAMRIHGYIQTLIPRWSDADDVFQETSRVLWEKFEQFEPGSDFFAWACRIAHYQALYYRQRQKRSRLQFSDEFLNCVDEHFRQRADVLSTQHESLAACVQQLAPRDKQLIQLRYHEQATVKTIAENMERGIDAIYKALNRIQEALLNCIRRAQHEEQSP